MQGWYNREARYSEYHRWSADQSKWNPDDFTEGAGSSHKVPVRLLTLCVFPAAVNIYGAEQLKSDLRFEETASMLQSSLSPPHPAHSGNGGAQDLDDDDIEARPLSRFAQALARAADEGLGGHSSAPHFTQVPPPQHLPVQPSLMQTLCPSLAMYQQLLFLQMHETSPANRHYIDKLKEELLRRFESQYLCA